LPFTQQTKNTLDTLIQWIIRVDLVVILLLFLKGQFDVSFPFPLLGNKLNNPLALLLLLFSIRVLLNVPFRNHHLGTLRKLLTATPHRIYFFAFLITIEIALQIMWFAYPENFLWNLNAEQGYGTHFSAIQLYLLGLTVLMTAWADYGKDATWKEKLPWCLVASVYFFIGLDDCVGIHENLIFWGRNLIPESTTFHFIHEWLWFYGPVALVVVIFLSRFFLMKFLYSPRITVLMFVALMFWVSVLLLEGLAKNIIDPMGIDYGRLLIGLEEGSEMFGATLFMLGFSKHLKNLLEKQ
jgi:hypothetical protein